MHTQTTRTNDIAHEKQTYTPHMHTQTTRTNDIAHEKQTVVQSEAVTSVSRVLVSKFVSHAYYINIITSIVDWDMSVEKQEKEWERERERERDREREREREIS